MRFVNRAGLGLLLACAPLTGVGCASLSPKMSSIPLMARKMAAADQYRTALHAEQKQDYNAARDQYALLQKEFPNDAVYAHRMGVVCTQLGEFTTAEKYFEHARKLEPGNVVLLTDMGYAAIVQKDYARAEALLDAAVRLKPDDHHALNNLAMAVGFQGRFDESLALFSKINGESQALVNIAYIHTQRAERKQAIACYRRAAQLDPNNKLATESLAKLVSSSPSAAVVASVPSPPPPPSLKKQPDKIEAVPKPAEEVPLVKHVAAADKKHPRVTAARPRDRVSDEQELPFFEDGENVARSIAAAYEKTSATASRDSDKPLIVPEESFVRPAVTPPPKNKVVKSATRPSSAEPTQTAETTRKTAPIRIAAKIHDELQPQEEASTLVAVPETLDSPTPIESTAQVASTPKTKSPTRDATIVPVAATAPFSNTKPNSIPELIPAPEAIEFTEPVGSADTSLDESASPAFAADQTQFVEPVLAEEELVLPEEHEVVAPAAPVPVVIETVVPEKSPAEKFVAKTIVPKTVSPKHVVPDTDQTQFVAPVLAEQELLLPEEHEVVAPAAPVPVVIERIVPEKFPADKFVAKTIVPKAVSPKHVVPDLVIPEPALTISPAAEELVVEEEVEVATAKAEGESEAALVEPGPPLIPMDKPVVKQTTEPEDFGLDESSPESKRADSEELTVLDWVKEQKAELLAAGTDVTEAELLEAEDGLKGFCPVAIRDERRLAVALDEFACEHQGQTYRFYSAAALEKFQAHPEIYAPIAGGLDIVAVRKGETVFNGSLDFAVWYRHRLHLFNNIENLAAFRAAPRTFASVP